MKTVKFGIFALSMGLFIASCGNGENKTTTTDTTMIAPAATPATAPAAADTMQSMPADTTHTSGGMMDTTKRK